MKAILKTLVLILILFSESAVAQDTVSVQTFTFSDINKRRGVYAFPGDTATFRKILMYYTLKCDPATTWDQYACGEWDYLTYSTIHKHTGELDSTATTAPWFLVGKQSPDSVYLSPNPIYDHYESYLYNIVYDAINSENDFLIGSGPTSSNFPFNSSSKIRRVQYLWLASELTASGLTSGTLDRMKFDLSVLGSTLENLTIRMKATTSTSLTAFDNSTAFATLYKNNHTFSTTGINSIDFTSPFNWNGINNLIVEISYSNSTNGTDNEVMSESTAFNSAVVSSTPNRYLECFGNDFVIIPVDSFSNVSNQITISFWQYGDPATQPEDGTLFEAVNNSNQRILNSHLPWSNGSVYWDAGLDPSTGGYDRINKAAVTSEYEGKWNHWAFTKNATNGTMKIYLNGVQWHQGTNLFNTMEGVTQFKIASNFFNTNTYNGRVDEFTIWNKELDAATIPGLMNQKITSSHPDYANLLYYYRFEESSGPICMNEVNGQMPATLVGMGQRKEYNAYELKEMDTILAIRPNITFVRGSYTSHFDSTLVSDSLLQPETSLWFYNVNGNYAVAYDTVYGWQDGYSYTYTNGMATDSTLISGGILYVNDTLNYFNPPFEVIDNYEIGRYITPYGIGLSLGSTGTTWIYDVTDYEPLLHDTVEISAGNTQELIDLKFLLIKGTPARDVKSITKVWTGLDDYPSYSYANLDNDVSLSAKTIQLDTAASSSKIKTRITGHGHNSNDGSYPHCCEWKNNTHYFYVNGTQVDNWSIWQTNDCALNPVYPQGGTWPGSREGWCPGDKVKEHDIEITPFVTADSITFDYDITPVPASNLGMGGGNYVLSVHLFQYDSSNFSTDAEIYEVLNPTDFKIHSRYNPVCDDPIVVLRNGGTNNLTTVTFTYSVSGGTPLTYTWNGNLGFMETENVALPVAAASFWSGDGQNDFIVSISNPNNVSDENTDNDNYRTNFILPPVHMAKFAVWLKANNYPTEDSYTIKDINGNVVMSRSGLTTQALYKDTVDLPYGCYTFELTDTGNDGLYYWADAAQGSGYLQLRSMSGGLIKNFEPEFGRTVFYAFSVGNLNTVDEIGSDPFIELFPNPNNGTFNLRVIGIDGNSKVEVINSIGQVISDKSVEDNGELNLHFNLPVQKSGIYFVRVINNGKMFTKKMMVE